MGGRLGRFLECIEWTGSDVAVDDTKRSDGCCKWNSAKAARGHGWNGCHWRPPRCRANCHSAVGMDANVPQSATPRRKLLSDLLILLRQPGFCSIRGQP